MNVDQAIKLSGLDQMIAGDVRTLVPHDTEKLADMPAATSEIFGPALSPIRKKAKTEITPTVHFQIEVPRSLCSLILCFRSTSSRMQGCCIVSVRGGLCRSNTIRTAG